MIEDIQTCGRIRNAKSAEIAAELKAAAK